MKVFLDTNVYVAETLLGEAAEQMLEATEQGAWRIYASERLLDELQRVMTEKLGFSRRLTLLSRRRISRRAQLVEPGASRHKVPDDPADSPILRAALMAGADYLVTNDTHLLVLDPYEGLRIISMTDYHQLLIAEGLLPQAS
jgi:putative PIN family toxin of toxin-antitoxin system